MNDFYRIPAVSLLSILLIVFLLLYLQNRTNRRLLWLLGWTLIIVRLVIEMTAHHQQGALYALANGSMVLASFLFLGSMSPLAFPHAPRLLYVYAFAAPVVLYAGVVSFYPDITGTLRILLMLCILASVAVALLWSLDRPSLPPWLCITVTLAAGMFGIWQTYQGEDMYVLYLAQSASNLVTGLLFLNIYRRLSPGAVFTSAGFFLWGAPIILESFLVYSSRPSLTLVARGVNLIKVVTAVGMILLVLEDELAQNKAAKERDHRARLELERYSAIDLSLLSGAHPEAAYQDTCDDITSVSCFEQALIFLHGVENRFHVAAHSGMNAELVGALEALGRRITPERARLFKLTSSVSVEMGNTLLVDLRDLFEPGDTLEQLQYIKTRVICLRTRAGLLDGMIFLSGLKQPAKHLQADDLLPLELLAARLAAARENTALMHRVSRAEKLAGLGQLATGLAHELNNPLTVVLGYSELVEETLAGHPAQRDASLIRSEARRMRQTIESMLRFWRPSRIEPVSISIASILEEVYRLRRPDFDRRRVLLQLQIADNLPPIHGNKTQIQQVLLRVLENSLGAFDGLLRTVKPLVQIDASHHTGTVKIVITHNGQAFSDPDRVFDPFYSEAPTKPGTGMGLSVCYAVVRDHGGEISAHNLQPAGAAVVIDFPFEDAMAASTLQSEGMEY